MSPKKASKNTSSPSATQDLMLDLHNELNVASGRLLESTASMHSFVQALNASGFREYVDYMGRPWRSFWFNFLIGIARGLGFVIGATVVVAIVVWIISRILSQLPFVGNFFDTLAEFLSKENLQNLQSNNFMDSVGKLFDAFRANVLDHYPGVFDSSVR